MEDGLRRHAVRESRGEVSVGERHAPKTGQLAGEERVDLGRKAHARIPVLRLSTSRPSQPARQEVDASLQLELAHVADTARVFTPPQRRKCCAVSATRARSSRLSRKSAAAHIEAIRRILARTMMAASATWPALRADALSGRRALVPARSVLAVAPRALSHPRASVPVLARLDDVLGTPRGFAAGGSHLAAARRPALASALLRSIHRARWPGIYSIDCVIWNSYM